jgi:hypothetical protein
MVKSDLGAVDAATHTVSVLDLRERRQLSARAFFGPLQRLLRDKLQESRTERLQHGLLFSAVHLNFLWHRSLLPGLLHGAADHINCLRPARERLPVSTTFTTGLSELLNQASKDEWPASDLHAFVASALLMDAYPPGMHRKWETRWSAFPTMADPDKTVFG